MLLLKRPRTRQPICCLAFAPDGGTLAACARHDGLTLWDLRTGAGRVLSDVGWVTCAAFSPDGRTLAWGNMRGTFLLEIATGRRTSLPRGGVWRLAFSPDGRFLGSAPGPTVWEMPDGRPLTRQEPPLPGTLLAFSPDGRILATAHWAVPPLPRGRRREHMIRLSDTVTGAERLMLYGPGEYPTGMAFSPDGRLLAAACGQFLRVWEAGTGEVVWRHKIDRRHFRALAFTPDSRFLLASHNDPTVRVWEVGTWQQRAAHDWKIGRVHCLDVAPDGMRAAVGGDAGRIVVWDLDF